MSNVYRSNKKSGGITPTGTKQITINAAGTTTHDVAAYANAEVTTSGLVKPTGTKQITINAAGTTTHDVAAYANAEVTTSGLVKPTGTKTITENGTGIDVANYEFVDVNVSGGGSLIETVLWENSAPSSSFNNQSIQLNESLLNYDYIRVECNYSTTSTTINGSTIIPVSEFIGTYYDSTTSRFFFGLVGRGQNILTRCIANGSSSSEGNNIVFFSNCFLYNSQTGQQQNSYVIPTKIIGLKLGGADMPELDIANRVEITTSPITTSKKGAIIGSFYISGTTGSYLTIDNENFKYFAAQTIFQLDEQFIPAGSTIAFTIAPTATGYRVYFVPYKDN